jgi:hypothetical protein
MQTIHVIERTGADGTLNLRVPLGRPDTEFDVVLVVQPREADNDGPLRLAASDRWAAINAFRE